MVDEAQAPAGSVNEVDTSPETVAAEWARIEAEAGHEAGPAPEPGQADTAPALEASRADATTRIQGWLKAALQVGFSWGVPAWQVSQQECQRLAEVWAKVAARYLPPAWLRFIPAGSAGGESVCIECDALAVTVEILAPRLTAPGSAQAAPEPAQESRQEEGQESRQEESQEPGQKIPAQFAYAADFPNG